MPRKPTPEGPEAPDETAGFARLAELGQALIHAAGDKQREAQVTEDVAAFLGSISPKDFPQLADNPVVTHFLEQIAAAKIAARPDDPPGTVYNAGTLAATAKPWTLADLKAPPAGWREGDPLPPGHTQWVYDYMPRETRSVVVNGIPVMFFADMPWTGPKVFVDQLDASRRADRAGFEHAAYMFKQGPFPSDPTIVNEATRRVRAQSSQPMAGTGFQPGAGVGPSFWAGAAEEAGGEETESEGEAA